MPRLPLFPSRRHERGGSRERTDGNLTTEEEWFLEIKLDDLNLSNDSTWLTLRGKRKRMRERETERGRRKEEPSPLHRERRAPQCTEKQFRLPQFRQNESAPPRRCCCCCSRRDWMEVVMAGGGRDDGTLSHMGQRDSAFVSTCQVPRVGICCLFIMCQQ